ncbi:MAG: AbrB/MazE/SpoVT family DNA-binding domain-containing protein [Chromatiaceae bacterium]
MQENLVVSARGQITLPATLRKRFGIRPGDVVIEQDRFAPKERQYCF